MRLNLAWNKNYTSVYTVTWVKFLSYNLAKVFIKTFQTARILAVYLGEILLEAYMTDVVTC